MELLSLEEYTKMAVTYIKSIGSQWLTDENIGIAVKYLVNSDKMYDPNKGASISTYRYGALINAKFKMFAGKQNKTMSLSATVDDKIIYSAVNSSIRSPLEILEEQEDEQRKLNVVDELVNNPNLTNTERKYIRMIYVDGMSRGEIAEKCNVTKQAVSYTEQNALRKLRELYV